MILFQKVIEKLKQLRLHITNLSLYVLAPLLIAILNIFVNPIMAANLSHADYAIMGYYTSFNLLFTPFLSFNIISFYTRNYFKLEESKREQAFNTIMLALVGIGIIGLFIILSGFYIYHRLNNISFSFFPFAFYSFAQLFFANFINLTQVQHRMKREAKKYFSLSISNALLSICFALIFVVLLKGGASAKLGSALLSTLIVGVFCIVKQLKKIDFDKKLLKEALSFSWPITISAMLWFFLSGIDRSFLEKLNDNHNMGLYSIAIQVTGYLSIIYTASSQTFEPDLYKAIAEKKTKKLIKIISGIQLINLIPILIFVIAARPVIHILTMGIYDDADDFARILAFKNFTMALFFSVNIIVIGSGFTRFELLSRVASAIFSYFLFMYLISNYGFTGAAWGQVLSFLFMAIFSFCFIIVKIKKTW